MERPAIKQVSELARENKVQCIVVKDFSRFARNYIEMGTYLEQILSLIHIWSADTDMMISVIIYIAGNNNSGTCFFNKTY